VNRACHFTAPAAAAALVLAGCAANDRDAGFRDVRDRLGGRIDADIHWNRGGPDDEAVEARIDYMLAQPLTRDAAVQVALLNNRRLQAVYEDLTIAQADLVQAGLLKNPIFEAAVGFPLEGGQAELSLGIVQDFLDIFFIPLRKHIAEAEFDSAKWLVTGEVMSLAVEVEQSFYEHQADVQVSEMLEQVVRSTGASYDAAQRLYDAGNITRLALASERALHEESRINLANAIVERDASRERLNVLLGVWGEQTQWTVAARLPEPTEDSFDLLAVERNAIANSVDLASARARINALARQLGFERSTSVVREVELGAEADREDGHWDLGPTVAIPIPIFDQGQARIAGAAARMRRAIEEYTALAVDIRSRARTARDRYINAGRLVAFIRDELLPLREHITQQTLLEYNAMQVGVFDLLRAKEGQIDAGRQYIEALRAYWLARSTLESIDRGKIVDTPRSERDRHRMTITVVSDSH